MIKNTLIVILLLVGIKYSDAQIETSDFKQDLYNRAFTYYFDSVLNREHYFDKIPEEPLPEAIHYINKFLIVSDDNILFRIPDIHKGIICTKISQYDFCKMKSIKWTYFDAIFIEPAIVDGLNVDIWICDYYSKEKNCAITYDSCFEFKFKYNIPKEQYYLEKMEYHGMVVK